MALSTITQEQFDEHKRALKQAILWCIFYREQEIDSGRCGGILEPYMVTLEDRLVGLNSLFGNQEVILQILELIEAAKLIYIEDCDCGAHNKSAAFKKFRKYILDSRSLIDNIVLPVAVGMRGEVPREIRN